jgi:ribonuclease BN (tRNA processing enzyme)/DNA-binding response OmpR family regulator
VRVKFWGTRGSIAKPGPTTLRYGGNTSCVELRSERGTLVVVDCGTGAHGLGEHLLRSGGGPVDGHIVFSHTHWDHIQGLPFFAPLFRPGNTWHIYGPRGLEHSIRETLSGQMEYSYFPITPDQMNATVHYHDLVEGTFEIDDIRVVTHYLNHPALTLGYRFEVDGAAVVYASDHEPHDRGLAAGGDLTTSHGDAGHLDFLRNADLLVHDTQYLAAEYPTRVGWGHSTVEYVVDAACQAGVGRLAVYHHDPGRTDDAVDDLLVLARARVAAAGSDVEVVAAAEGLELRVASRAPAIAGGAPTVRSARQTPALDVIDRSIVTVVHHPDVAGLLREAARAEGIDVRDANDGPAAIELLRMTRSAVVVVEDEPDGAALALAEAVLELNRSTRNEVAVVGVVGSHTVRTDLDSLITDWLVWPSSVGHVRTKLRAWLLRRACLWQNAPLPDDEERRLRSLHELGVLDTGPELRFDRLTREASSALDVPVALVSLVDQDRQWFKSKVGLDLDETPREIALCAHAILGDDVLHVPDTLLDTRFADNPVVQGEPRVRFYAGAPLTLSDGTKAGTLCVIDFRPRLLDADQLAELRRLADLVTEQLEGS